MNTLINRIIRSCAERYHQTQCNECSYLEHCPHNCGRCLHYIHTPTSAPAPRKYDCQRMADYYVCKYASKYTSELFYAFTRMRSLEELPKLKVLSIGCGPCTDLFALDLVRAEQTFLFDELDYRGIDINTEIWENELNDIHDNIPLTWSVRIIDADVCEVVSRLFEYSWRPNLIVLQYVFSDMRKNCSDEEIYEFIDALAAFIDDCPDDTYIVCNDINLSTCYQGGREYFDILLDRIQSKTLFRQNHFYNNNKSNHYEYGDEYDSNELIIDPPDYADFSSPYNSCASAQIIIKKVSDNDN